MRLNVCVSETTRPMDVPDDIIRDAEEFFRKMDQDMDRGWQMSREFVENPDRVQRCQIAAHRLLGALSAGNHSTALLMAAYILKRAPGVVGVDVDTTGEISNTQLLYAENGAAPAASPPRPEAAGAKPSKMQALEQAGKEVSKVYKVGHVYRYAVLDAASGQWIESAPIDDLKEAEAARLRAFKQRFDELTR